MRPLRLLAAAVCVANAERGQALDIEKYIWERAEWHRTFWKPAPRTALEHGDTLEAVTTLYFDARRLHPWLDLDEKWRQNTAPRSFIFLGAPPYSFVNEGIQSRVPDDEIAPGWLSFLPLGYVYPPPRH